MCIGSGLFDHALLLLKYGARADVADAAGRPLPYTLAEQSALPANAGMQDKILQVADALLKNGASATQAAPGLPPLSANGLRKPPAASPALPGSSRPGWKAGNPPQEAGPYRASGSMPGAPFVCRAARRHPLAAMPAPAVFPPPKQIAKKGHAACARPFPRGSGERISAC